MASQSEYKSVYKIMFHNQNKVYEVYARGLHQSGLYGFIEIEELIFGERSQVVVDPSEEKLKLEFEGVKRSYIPMHAVIRVDEVSKEGVAKITDSKGGSVTPFPMPSSHKSKES